MLGTHHDMLVNGTPGSPSADLRALFGKTRLTPAQRRIAQCLTERVVEATYLSASELAELAGVSQPSVTRFAVALGFSGYPDLRRRLRALAIPQVQQAVEEARPDELHHALSEEISNISRLERLLEDRAAIDQACELLVGSSPLPIVGLRASSGLANYFGFFASKVHHDVRLLTSGGSHLVDRIEQAAAGGATAVLAFVLPRYPVESIDALHHAQRLGLRTVTITDSEFSPVRDVSNVLLPASVGSRLVFDSQSAPMLLAMIVLQEMCNLDPKTTQTRLEAFERSAADRRIFVQ
jgi:DNA-binding MurR/RpiR family transcriptional regulator